MKLIVQTLVFSDQQLFFTKKPKVTYFSFYYRIFNDKQLQYNLLPVTNAIFSIKCIMCRLKTKKKSCKYGITKHLKCNLIFVFRFWCKCDIILHTPYTERNHLNHKIDINCTEVMQASLLALVLLILIQVHIFGESVAILFAFYSFVVVIKIL